MPNLYSGIDSYFQLNQVQNGDWKDDWFFQSEPTTSIPLKRYEVVIGITHEAYGGLEENGAPYLEIMYYQLLIKNKDCDVPNSQSYQLPTQIIEIGAVP